MDSVFFDSNVILYLLSGDSSKADRAEALLNKGGIISVQVLNEVTSVCLRKLKMSWEEIDALLLAVKAACEKPCKSQSVISFRFTMRIFAHLRFHPAQKSCCLKICRTV